MGLRVLALGACLLLTGCLVDGASPGTPGFAADGATGGGLFAVRPPLRLARVADGAVVIVGPEGYCLDRRSFRAGTALDGAFAILASCNTLTGGRGGIPVQPVLMTVTVGDRVAPGALPDAAALGAAAGRRVDRRVDQPDLAMVHLSAGGENVFEGADPAHWRGITRAGGRLVSLAAYAPRGSEMAGEGGGRLLADLAASIRAASPGPAGPAAPVATE